MATAVNRVYSQLPVTALGSALNSLANNTLSAASGTVDNTAGDMFLDVEVSIAAQGGARIAGGTIVLFLATSLDGTSFDSVNETTAEIIGTWTLDASANARRRTFRDVPIPPTLFQLFIRNVTGQAFAAEGNTVRYRTYSVTERF